MFLVLIKASETEVIIKNVSDETKSIVSVRYQCDAEKEHWENSAVREALLHLPLNPPSLAYRNVSPPITGVEYDYPIGEVDYLAAKKAFSENENAENCNRLSMAIVNKDKIKKIISFVVDNDLMSENFGKAADPIVWGWAYFAIGEDRGHALRCMRAVHYMGKAYNAAAELHDRVSAQYPEAKRVGAIKIPWRTFDWIDTLNQIKSAENRTFGDFSAVRSPTEISVKGFWYSGAPNFCQKILDSAETGKHIIISDLIYGPCARSAYIYYIGPVLADSIPLAMSTAKIQYVRDKKWAKKNEIARKEMERRERKKYRLASVVRI